MSSYTVYGGSPLQGEITVSGNKNSALPCIAAALLTDEEVVLHNIPEIEDVQVMLAIAETLGVAVKRIGTYDYRLRTVSLSGTVPPDLADKVRASILFAGPLLARTGEVELAPPGGDVIGLRRLDTHFAAFKALGAEARILEDQTLHIDVAGRGKLTGSEIFLDEMSVTATENILMAAAAAAGTTVIRNAASEPHVQDLCRLLVRMGAKITGIGSNLLTVTGQSRLHGAEFTIGPDFMEIGSFVGLTAAVGGRVLIHGVDPAVLPVIGRGFRKIGALWRELPPSTILVESDRRGKVEPDIGGMIPKIDDAPWPGFPPDLISIVTVAATQAEGTVLIHEKMFESRMYFIDMLIRMGARIILCDPHRAVVSGPTPLHGTLLTSPDIRAGMALVIAALCAGGKSVIQNAYQIERGYENLCGKLQALGADIRREGGQNGV
jgi:UDP-N-acetylglucosamine 1-carboxyvinyltransferase